MEKCQKKDRLYNSKTKRCYKSCEQKQKDTHPVTQKCRKKCNKEKVRRAEDFRCVKKTSKIYKKKTVTKKAKTPTPKAQEELVPPPLQKELQKNFQFLHDLIQKGQGKTVKYDGDMVSEFITVYFHERYKQHCPMYPIRTYSHFDTEEYKEIYKKYIKKFRTEEALKSYMLNGNKYGFIDWNKDKFLKNLKLCLETGEEIIIVPLRIPEHLNMLIVKAPTREIIRFEPHGSMFSNVSEDNKTNLFLEKLTVELNNYLNLADNRKFVYVKPSKLCPNYNANLSNYKIPGFQSMEGLARELGKGEGGGFCQLWSWFFAECVIQNPEMDVKEVYKEAFNALKTNEDNFATIIRGYFFSINDELKKMNTTYTIQKTKKETWTDADILLDYLKQSQVNLKNKERKPFTGGKKHTFILPKANPKATPVHF